MGILNSLKNFAIGSSGPMVFGLIDNGGLFLGMSFVEDAVLSAGFDSQVAAGIGNTFSDALGALAGGSVTYILFKTLKVKGEGSTAQQFVGVIVGCMIPVVIKVLYTMQIGI